MNLTRSEPNRSDGLVISRLFRPISGTCLDMYGQSTLGVTECLTLPSLPRFYGLSRIVLALSSTGRMTSVQYRKPCFW